MSLGVLVCEMRAALSLYSASSGLAAAGTGTSTNVLKHALLQNSCMRRLQTMVQGIPGMNVMLL